MKWQMGAERLDSPHKSLHCTDGETEAPTGLGAQVGQLLGEYSSHCGTRDAPRLRNLVANRESAKGQTQTAILSD